MYLLEVTTENGSKYIANVITQKVRRISSDGETKWSKYTELKGPGVGEPLTIIWPNGKVTVSPTKITEITHPRVGDDA